MKVDYPDLKSFIISYGIIFNNGDQDTVYTFFPIWKSNVTDTMASKLNYKLKNRIKFEIQDRIGSMSDSIIFVDHFTYK